MGIVTLSSKNQCDLQKIAAVTGQSLAAVTNEALDSWFETEGDVVLEKIAARTGTSKRTQSVVEFAEPHIQE
jgi:hypothetical protein